MIFSLYCLQIYSRQLETLQENSSKSEAKANQLREKIKRLEEQHNQDTVSINQTHENIITSLTNKHRLELGTLRNDHAAEMDILQSQLSQELDDMQQKHSEAVNKLTTEHNQRLIQLQNQLVSVWACNDFNCCSEKLPVVLC